MPEVAEDGAVEVNEAEEAGADAQGEDEHHGGEGSALAQVECHRGGRTGVREDVPEQEHQDSCGKRVQEALDALRQPAEPRHRKAEENGGSGDRTE